MVLYKSVYYYYYFFRPSVDIFPREFKNWDIQNWVQICQSVQSGVGKLSCNKTALKRCTSTETLFGTEKLLPCHRLRMRRSSFPNYQRVGMLTCSKVPRFQPRLERRGTDWSGKLCCSTCLAGGPSDVGFSQGAGDSYVPAQWPAALPWDECQTIRSLPVCAEQPWWLFCLLLLVVQTIMYANQWLLRCVESDHCGGGILSKNFSVCRWLIVKYYLEFTLAPSLLWVVSLMHRAFPWVAIFENFKIVNWEIEFVFRNHVQWTNGDRPIHFRRCCALSCVQKFFLCYRIIFCYIILFNSCCVHDNQLMFFWDYIRLFCRQPNVWLYGSLHSAVYEMCMSVCHVAIVCVIYINCVVVDK